MDAQTTKHEEREETRQQGVALIEAVIFLQVLVMLLFVLVEGSNALRSQMILQEASREAARMVMRSGSSDGVEELVLALTRDLDSESPVRQAVTENADNSITVRVQYVYQALLFGDFLENSFPDEIFEFEASTTMPRP